MKKKVVISICLIMSFVSASFGQSLTTQTYYKGGEINGLIIDGAFDVQLSEGMDTGVEIKIREDLLGKLSVTISENRYVNLSFGDDISKYFTGKNKKPLVKVVVSKLDILRVGGNVSVLCKGYFDTNSSFSLSMAGGSFIGFLKIKAPNANIEIAGAAKIEDSEFNIDYDLKMATSETAYASAKLSCQNLFYTSSMSSKSTLLGSASSSAKVTSSGTSKLGMLGFVCQDIIATAMDMSRIDANVTGTASITKSSMASFRYVGNGTVSGEGAKRL